LTLTLLPNGDNLLLGTDHMQMYVALFKA